MAKSKYDTHVAPFLDKIALWAQNGASQNEIADKLHLSPSTFKLYLSRGDNGEAPYSDLTDRFRPALEIPDDNVEAAMYKRACGIYWDEKTYATKWNESAQQWEEICVKRVTKFVPPDPTSAMFWLSNRRPDKWRYRPDPNSIADEEGGYGVIELPSVMTAPIPPKEVM